jgi:hypothetical protein
MGMLKNITLTAEQSLIANARKRAAGAGTTLNELFRDWLARYVAQPGAADAYDVLMAQLNTVRAGRAYTREEMNERG